MNSLMDRIGNAYKVMTPEQRIKRYARGVMQRRIRRCDTCGSTGMIQNGYISICPLCEEFTHDL